ncbi:MAG: hypothetical protein LBO72_08765 [Helicobacteraceae bacterium]|jgi:hypothetical protein|nr:hypothetical protein [Helicobacteraceae bacterium]
MKAKTPAYKRGEYAKVKRVCVVCGAEFEGRSDALYCSNACNLKAYRSDEIIKWIAKARRAEYTAIAWTTESLRVAKYGATKCASRRQAVIDRFNASAKAAGVDIEIRNHHGANGRAGRIFINGKRLPIGV